MNPKMRILIVEDLPSDAELCEREVKKVLGSCEFRRVETRAEYLAALEQFSPTLIVSDFKLPHFDGLTALRLAVERAPDVPFIILTGSVNEDTAVECMKAGAWDYVIKEHVKRLGPAILGVLEQKRLRGERMKGEAALRESEQQLREAQRLGRIGHWEFDPQTLQIRWSDMVFTIYGRDPRLGPPTVAEEAAYYSNEDAERLRECARRTIEAGEPYEIDACVRLPGGRVVDVVCIGSAVRDSSGRLVRLLGTVQDITQRRRAEVAARESEEKFRRVFDKVHDGILVADQATQRFVLANETMGRMVGYTREELLRLGVADLHPAQDMDRLAAGFDKQSRGEMTISPSLPVKRKDGTVFLADVSATPISLAGRDCLVGCFSDVTERDKLRASIAQSDRLASMGMLAAGVAHEINNPLAYILYNLESLANDIPRLVEKLRRCREVLETHLGAKELNELLGDAAEIFAPLMFEDITDCFKDALGGTRRIREIARGLGTFSRVEHDQLTPVSIEYAIECAANMAFNEIKYRARLVKDFATVPRIMGSEGRLAQVFLNLLVNAAHAIDEGDVEHNEIRVRTWQDGGEACVEVRDTGKGIPKENLERIFEPFFTTKSVGVGSGLGLAITRNIITGYGGRIEVKSEVGKGTSFFLRLPIKQGGESAATEPVTAALAEPKESGVRGRILVIDDEPGIRGAMKRMLREHEVLEAFSGEEARELLEKDQKFDLILCDMMMPAVSGMDLHEWLTKTHPNLAKRVVFVTGGAFTPRARDYLARVDNLRLEKPFDTANFKKLVSELILAARSKK